MTDQKELEEQLEAKARFKELAQETGTCPAFRVFQLGANGTVYVGCGLPKDHEADTSGPEESSNAIPFHQTQQGDHEGDLIVFRWPV